MDFVCTDVVCTTNKQTKILVKLFSQRREKKKPFNGFKFLLNFILKISKIGKSLLGKLVKILAQHLEHDFT